MVESFVILLLLLLLSFSFFFFIILGRKLPREPSLPPGPPSWPILGNLLDMGVKEMPHVALARLAQAHGPLISLRMGMQFVVVASSPSAAVEVLKTHDRELSGRHVPDVLYTKSPRKNHLSMAWTHECTERWKFLRTLCRSELFGSKKIEAQSRLRAEKVREMVEFVRSKEGQPLNIAAVVFHNVFNFLSNTFFSRDLTAFREKGDDDEVSGLVRETMELGGTLNISDFYPLLAPLDLQGLRGKVDVAANKILHLWKPTLKERREKRHQSGEERKNGDFLDFLLENGFSDEQIDILLMELFAAGTDTTTTTVEWTLAELLRNRAAMRKVREELEQQVSESSVTEAHLPKLSYLQACVKENLRLHPPAPLLVPRRAVQDCSIMNYTIPKGTQVLVNVWAIGRDPNVWDDPLSFRPERFLGSDMDFKGNDFEYLPFGGGRRMCPGLPMGVRQVHFILANLIHHFQWSHPNGRQLHMGEKFGVTLDKEQPLVLVPKRIR